MKKILIGGLTGAVIGYFVLIVIFSLGLLHYFQVNITGIKEDKDVIWWGIILTNLAYGFLLSVIFSWSNTKGMIAGLKSGAIIGLLVFCYRDFDSYSSMTVFNNLSIVIADIALNTAATAITGGVVAWVMGKVK